MRKWHRWVSLLAAIFLLSVGVTGIILQIQQFFGEDEATRERLATMVSAYSLDSPLDVFAPKLAAAQAAVRAKVGSDKLDNVELQLKGDHPTFVLHTSGVKNQKFIVNANTAAIEKQADDERESLMLRIHTGEILGDGGVVGGMLWGTALVVLTITGSILYWQMYRARAKVKGWKRIFWCALWGAAIPLASGTSARADSPFFTDDPLFSPGWEIKLGAAAERNRDGNVVTGPILDINYAIVPIIRLDLTIAGVGLNPDSGPGVYGFGTTDFKVKWRFLEEYPSGWRPALSIAPKVTIPTARTDRGLSDGIWRAQLPIELGKNVGNCYHFAEAGYQWALDGSASDVAFWGVGILYNFDKHFALGAELYGLVPVDQPGEHTSAATLGAIYTFNGNWSLKASISHSLRDDEQPGPRPAVVFYVVWNF
jgi:hypothetical protein